MDSIFICFFTCKDFNTLTGWLKESHLFQSAFNLSTFILLISAITLHHISFCAPIDEVIKSMAKCHEDLVSFQKSHNAFILTET